jgi:hypothetical protein
MELNGTVYISCYDDIEGYTAYWDALPDGPPAMLEENRLLVTAREAVSWGRARAPRVFILLEGDSEPRWAGTSDIPEDVVHLNLGVYEGE